MQNNDLKTGTDDTSKMVVDFQHSEKATSRQSKDTEKKWTVFPEGIPIPVT